MFLLVALHCASAALPASLPLRPVAASPAAATVRYCYEGGTFRRDGRLLSLDVAGGDNVLPTGQDVLEALEADGADLEHFTPRAYDETESGWAPLTADTSFSLTSPSCQRVDVTLFRKKVPPPPADFDGEQASIAGFFTCGVVGAKHSHNLGTLWRSAFQLGAAGIFVVADRGAAGGAAALAPHKEASDTTKAWRSIPMWQHSDWNAFCEAQPYGAVLVAVEMGGEATLDEFVHPERAVYLLGAEDTGLPQSVVRACHRHVTLPCERYESFNVAVAGSLVMYDRLAKVRAKRRTPSPPSDETDAPPTSDGKPRPRGNLFVTRKGGSNGRRRRLR